MNACFAPGATNPQTLADLELRVCAEISVEELLAGIGRTRTGTSALLPQHASTPKDGGSSPQPEAGDEGLSPGVSADGAGAGAAAGAGAGAASNAGADGSAHPTRADVAPRYFLLDCRPAEEFEAGHLPTAFHLDPQLLLHPEELVPLMEGFLRMKGVSVGVASVSSVSQPASQPARQSFTQRHFHSSAPSGCHFAIMGSGFSAADLGVDADGSADVVELAAAFFLQHKFHYFSEVAGGFRALHDAHDDDLAAVLVGHDPAACLACFHGRRGSLRSLGQRVAASTRSVAAAAAGRLGVSTSGVRSRMTRLHGGFRKWLQRSVEAASAFDDDGASSAASSPTASLAGGASPLRKQTAPPSNGSRRSSSAAVGDDTWTAVSHTGETEDVVVCSSTSHADAGGAEAAVGAAAGAGAAAGPAVGVVADADADADADVGTPPFRWDATEVFLSEDDHMDQQCDAIVRRSIMAVEDDNTPGGDGAQLQPSPSQQSRPRSSSIGWLRKWGSGRRKSAHTAAAPPPQPAEAPAAKISTVDRAGAPATASRSVKAKGKQLARKFLRWGSAKPKPPHVSSAAWVPPPSLVATAEAPTDVHVTSDGEPPAAGTPPQRVLT